MKNDPQKSPSFLKRLCKKSLLFILGILCITSCGSEKSSTKDNSSSASNDGNESKADESSKTNEETSEDTNNEPSIS